ncbi:MULTISPECIES: amidohydrolase [unclassified Brevibacterium]|uniref:amidohydrolase n=1 Tax=unclassified Brevibacterium TaxID=2614124 RepID=UPI0010F941FB|nr:MULTISPECIES: amidohydrolase [unclassified Brevibacterium]MCM1013046.1 amidohydrolase [Brevibacterium sp. XM4083]
MIVGAGWSDASGTGPIFGREAKATACAWVDDHLGELLDWHAHIWNLAEPAWREYESQAWYVSKLRAEGFEVESGSGGMPTAFFARWTNCSDTGLFIPTLLTYAEYDAVPGNCQADATMETPRSGLNRFAPGHTDPHSALGISTLAGLLATKNAMEIHNIPGTLLYTGEPAEKMHGSKVVHGLRGYYDAADAIVSFHPFYMLPLCNTARWDTQCGAYYSKVYSFLCDSPETWQLSSADPHSPIPASHSAARAPGANLSLTTMYTMSRSMLDSMLPASGGWSFSDAILPDGQATADNLPHRVARVQFSWRTPDIEMAEHILKVLDRNAQAAALAGHCTVEERWVARSRPGRTNHVLAQALYDNLVEVGPPTYGSEAVEIARAMQRSLGVEAAEHPFIAESERLIEPQEAERQLRNQMPAWQTNWTSDDYVEMSHYAPLVRFYVSRPALASLPNVSAYPAWVMNALGGIRETISPTIVTAGKTIAGTFLDLLTKPEILARAKAEFESRAASEPMPALLPADFEAPFDLPWPDYRFDRFNGERRW